MRRGWRLLLVLGLFSTLPSVTGWSEQSQSVPEKEQREDDAILRDLEFLKDLEMLQMLEMLQDMEVLGELDPSSPPGSQGEEGAR